MQHAIFPRIALPTNGVADDRCMAFLPVPRLRLHCQGCSLLHKQQSLLLWWLILAFSLQRKQLSQNCQQEARGFDVKECSPVPSLGFSLV